MAGKLLTKTETALRLHRAEKQIVSSDLHASDFLHHLKAGHFFVERAYYLERLKLKDREIIPIREHTPQGTKRAIRDSHFRVSTDRQFEQVVNFCCLPRKDDKPEGLWLRGKLRRCLLDLKADGCAHSIEIWKDDALAGGLFGVHVGAAFISFSTFSLSSGAGNAALAELQARLFRADFQMHDIVLPSNTGIIFKSLTLTEKEDFEMRRRAMGIQLAFPLDPAILPSQEFPDTPNPRALIHGRPFTR